MTNKRYESGPDIIRVTAILFVIAGHFLFLHTPFRQIEVTNLNLLLQGICMSIFYVSVPLFIILTGYLNSYKNYGDITFKTYKSLGKVIGAYLFFAVLSVFWKELYLGQHSSVWQYFVMVFNYTISPYCWYIELYICLFLFMPFINILLKSLATKHNQLMFIAACIFCGFLPALLNRGGVQILPQLFSIVPSIVGYYAIGFYIAVHRPKLNKWLLVAGILAFACADGLFALIRQAKFVLAGGSIYSLYYAIIAVSIFLMLYDIDVKSKLLKKASLYTLDVYLCCWIFDSLYYPWFKEHFYKSQEQFFLYILIIVPAVYLSSLLIAWARHVVLNTYKNKRGG